jgi:hypothetical protein
MMMWSRSSPDPGFVSPFLQGWSWRESGRKESLIPAMSMERSIAEFSTGKRASFFFQDGLLAGMLNRVTILGSSTPALRMVAVLVFGPRLAGVCLARLQDCLFDGQFYLDDLGLLVGFTRWFHFLLLT